MSDELVLWACVGAVVLLGVLAKTAYGAIVAKYFWDVGVDVVSTGMTLIRSLPPAWYPLAAMSVLPAFHNIPMALCTAYLAAYCLCAWAVCNSVSRAPPQPQNVQTMLFMGVRIAGDRRHDT
jgi:hypothetical protein